MLGAIGMLLSLSSCGGGGGSSGDSSGYSEEGAGAEETAYGAEVASIACEPLNLLPGTSFMPKGFMLADLAIEGAPFALHISCQSSSYAAECYGEMPSSLSRASRRARGMQTRVRSIPTLWPDREKGLLFAKKRSTRLGGSVAEEMMD